MKKLSQKMKYLGQKYRPEFQAEFCLVPEPSLGILNSYPGLPLSRRAWGSLEGRLPRSSPMGKSKAEIGLGRG